MQHPPEKPECLNGLDAELHETADRLRCMLGRAVQTGLLKRGLVGRELLRHAREHALAILEDQVDVELDAVEVLLEEEVGA